MRKLSFKYKIIVLLLTFGLFMIGMFMFGYDILAERNQSLADIAAQQRLEYEVLVREQKSFEEGKKDLAELASKPYPPDVLFSRDTKVVKEIELLEQTALNYGVTMTLGVSGTTKAGTKVPGVTSELVSVPFVMNLEGPFENVMRYIQAAEHLPFVTYTKAVLFEAQQDGDVKATLNADFFIKK